MSARCWTGRRRQSDYQNILIIKMSSLGDVIHALPFAAALRETFPHSRISWLVHPQFSAFVPEPPIIDEVLYFDKKASKMGWGDKWKTLRETRALLRGKKFDLVIDLQGLFKSAVMAWLTGCPNRIGYCEMREGSRLVSRPIVGAHAHDHVIERYLDVARYLGAKADKITYPMPALKEEGKTIRRRLLEAGMPDQENLPYVVLVPGARWETKRWPLDHYAALARKFLAEGNWVVLAGGPEDAPLGKKIRELAGPEPHLLDWIGGTSSGNWEPDQGGLFLCQRRHRAPPYCHGAPEASGDHVRTTRRTGRALRKSPGHRAGESGSVCRLSEEAL